MAKKKFIKEAESATKLKDSNQGKEDKKKHRTGKEVRGKLYKSKE